MNEIEFSEFSLTIGCNNSNSFSGAAVRIKPDTHVGEFDGAAGPEIVSSRFYIVGLKTLKKPLEI